MARTHGLHIRPLRSAEVSVAVEWAAAEGWNPGLGDARIFALTDPGGFYGGFLEDKLAATISAVKYTSDAHTFGFIGFYIVKPEFRGRGFGFEIWQHGMRALAKVPLIGLDGVVDQQSNYRKSGFILAHRNIRYAGELSGLRAETVVEAATVPADELTAFDYRHFPVPRPEFLRLWLHQPGAHSLVLRSHSGVRALGTIRRCRSGWKVGPLFAADASCAETMLLALADRADLGSAIYLDVPETNGAAVALAQRHGMRPMFETARMYRGKDPQLPIDHIFGVTTFELG
ncbi:GNAT family N-acetyltransferase [Hoyosella altamirensis]|uniref:Ribosomal protein S18 acetylase RimI-like enzyme n=1 Tax=Hoyosella altamirensis TaxID=616997 RepID=A0A839RP11_9ACTN|nr:GNAT family N-acetyltransferase [Hoyosella altamirensis]MBB3038039.1 ribosomal protein S18 acetylase RimI-like enzyme [Hoyosella altamirensis]